MVSIFLVLVSRIANILISIAVKDAILGIYILLLPIKYKIN
jgi:hypothetical protein